MMILQTLRAHPRLLISFATAIVVFFADAGLDRMTTRLLLAYDCGVVLFLVLGWTMMARSDYETMQARADEEDTGALVVLVLTVAAATISLAAIGAELQGFRDVVGFRDRGLRLTLGATTILSSWLFVQTIFAIHYAHDYYKGEDDREGLAFPGPKDAPDYWDFMYFSMNLGAAAQTSDIAITAKRMRRFVLAHTILSFLFNTTVLALAINVGAGLLS